MTKPDGGPAFPVPQEFDDRRGEYLDSARGGMSMRDFIAAHALSGIIATSGAGREEPTMKLHASMAYRYADAMLAERTWHEDR